MPLHLDYRPKKLDEVVGNKQVISSLSAILEREDRPRSLLFHGPSGCGKTTLARIFASRVGCPPDINGNTNPDFQEINSSNNRGIDTAREIISGMQYKPLQGKARVYLLDECHTTTRDYQHAILKALEDTPKWVYFLLCTTEPEKLLKTILNRCAKFEVRPLNGRNMDRLLDWVLGEEGCSIPDAIQQSILKAADGCPRQALVILDQIIDLDEEDMQEAIRQIEIREQAVIDLCRALVRGDRWDQVRVILQGIEEDPEKVRRAVLGYLTSVVLNDKDGGFWNTYNAFRDPFFNTGKAGLVFACYEAVRE